MTTVDFTAPGDLLGPCEDCSHPDCERARSLADDLDVTFSFEDEAVAVDLSLAENVDRILAALRIRRRRVAEYERVHAVRVADMEAQRDKVRRENDTSWLEDQLASYHAARLRDDHRCKTITLPSGTLKARKAPDSLVVDDAETVLSWAHDLAPEMIRTRVEVDKTAAKRRLRPSPVGDGSVVDPSSGEVVPGLTWAEGETTYRAVTE